MDQALTVKELIEAGTHLGHRRDVWHPKMSPYIFAERKGICIIDPEKTLTLLMKACDAIKGMVNEGKRPLFVGTKKHIADVVKEEATRCGAFYSTHRWLGGTLTNFVTVRKSVEKLRLLEEQKEKAEGFTKKERLLLEKEIQKMHRNLDGIMDMEELPGFLYIVDIKKEAIALNEALKLSIPVVAIVDTNVDPTPISYPIPANDDAIRSIKLITKIIADAILEGKGES